MYIIITILVILAAGAVIVVRNKIEDRESRMMAGRPIEQPKPTIEAKPTTPGSPPKPGGGFKPIQINPGGDIKNTIALFINALTEQFKDRKVTTPPVVVSPENKKKIFTGIAIFIGVMVLFGIIGNIFNSNGGADFSWIFIPFWIFIIIVSSFFKKKKKQQ